MICCQTLNPKPNYISNKSIKSGKTQFLNLSIFKKNHMEPSKNAKAPEAGFNTLVVIGLYRAILVEVQMNH